MTRFNRDDVGYAIQLRGITQLEGLVEQYGPERVWAAAWEALDFHPRMINSFNEAAKVATVLAESN